MFKKSKKKAPPPPIATQSRANSYVIGEPPDFTAEQDFYQTSYLKPSAGSDQSNPESSSLSSVASTSTTASEDVAVSTGKGRKKNSLTFSTFLGTPQMSRKNKNEEVSDAKPPPKPETTGKATKQGSAAAKPPKPEKAPKPHKIHKHGASGQAREDGHDVGEGKKAKKQSVMSKVKNALSTPRLLRKSLKDVPGSPTSGRSNGKPAPPPPKRVSSLTREDGRRITDKYGQQDDLHFVNISDFAAEGASLETSITIQTFPNAEELEHSLPQVKQFQLDSNGNEPTHAPSAHIQNQSESLNGQVGDGDDVKTLSLDVDTVDLVVSDKIEELDSERCDTLQSVDYISDDEASESMSSSASAPQPGTAYSSASAHAFASSHTSASAHTSALANTSVDNATCIVDQVNVGKTPNNTQITEESQLQETGDSIFLNCIESDSVATEVIDTSGEASISENNDSFIRPSRTEVSQSGKHALEIDASLDNTNEVSETCEHRAFLTDLISSSDSVSAAEGTKHNNSNSEHDAPLSPVAPPRSRRKRTPTSQNRQADTPDLQVPQVVSTNTFTSEEILDKEEELSLSTTASSTTEESSTSLHSSRTQEKQTPSKPPVGPKPQWAKGSKQSPGTTMHTNKSKLLVRQSAHQSDTDSLSSSGYETKSPTKGAGTKARDNRKNMKVSDEECMTDDDLAMLSMGSSSSELLRSRLFVGRATTPTLELYNNASDISPNSRSVPSPRPESPRDVMVECEDDNEALNFPTGVLRKKSPHPNRMVKAISMPMQLGRLGQDHIQDNYDQYAHNELHEWSHNISYDEASPRINVHPPPEVLQHSMSLDTDVEIAEHFVSPRNHTRAQSLGSLSLRQRSSTPNLDHIRNLQRDNSFQNDIVVDNLRYRPSTPLIGGQHNDLSDSRIRSKDLLRKRVSTPAFGADYRDFNDDLGGNHQSQLEILSPRRKPLLATRPVSLDYGNGVHSTEANARWGNVAAPQGSISSYEQWGLPTNAAQRRPPSPVLRAKVNSVLDGLMSKPFNRSRQPVMKSISVDRLLNEQSTFTLPEPPHLTREYTQSWEESPRQFVSLSPRRPPSPFRGRLPSPRLGYQEQSDMDVELASHLELRHDVPPLNLDFTKQRLEDETGFTPRNLSNRFSSTGVQLLTPDNLTKLNINAQSFTLEEYLKDSPLPRDLRHTFPGYRSQTPEIVNQVPAGPQVPGDYTPEISSACLELSNPVSSDSENEADAGDRKDLQPGWQLKTAENWTNKDVTDWAFANGFYKIAMYFKGNCLFICFYLVKLMGSAIA